MVAESAPSDNQVHKTESDELSFVAKVKTLLPFLTMGYGNEVKALTGSEVQPVDIERDCLVLGPFVDVFQVDQLQKELNAIGVDGVERLDENHQDEDYWVYLAPMDNNEVTLRTLRQLQTQKIDSLLITRGEIAGGISLGIFPKRKTAEALKRSLSREGYQVEVKSLVKMPDDWWLEIDNDAIEKLSVSFWREVVNKYPKLKKIKKKCKNIATSNEIH